MVGGLQARRARAPRQPLTPVFDFFARRRRARLAAEPFPPAWSAILDRHVPLVRRLPPADRAELERLIRVFLAEKRIEGAGGLVVDDVVRLTIAAQACLLLLHRDAEPYPDLRTILVYPAGWTTPVQRAEGPFVVETGEARRGESWRLGPVVLSWADTRRDAADPADGDNVVLHEFAHQLDTEAGPADGAPLLPRREMYGPWAEVLGEAYRDLVADVDRQRPTTLDAYGAKSPAEFFAVATEAFFERPRALRRAHPALYAQLQAFYRQDPARWSG